ncbi:two-component regulator propeller domain-containing protein [Aliikangiella sp. IMCC44359]|uniref:two-component regulator propeller domain-containing protein n=1 Tax=Aliikangiella sp. IMCC44359 TaxID=3459125 RepID=UPI00403A7F65
MKANKRFEHYTIENGLSQNTIEAIYQDRYGFMWFGTRSGLDRFDGYRFINFVPNPDDVTTISDGFVSTILEDADGYLWVGTRNGGLNRYDPASQTFTQFTHHTNSTNNINNNRITSIIQVAHDELWIGTYGGGINILNTQTNSFRYLKHIEGDANSLNHDIVNALSQDKEGNIWIGTYGGGISKYVIKQNIFTHYTHQAEATDSISSNKVLDLMHDSNGRLWIATEGEGLNLYNADSNNFTIFKHDRNNHHSISNNAVTTIIEDHHGRLWIGTESGLNILDTNKQVFTTYKKDALDRFSLSGDSITALYQSKDDVIWIGAFTEGLNKFNVQSEQFTHFKKQGNTELSLNANNIWALQVGSSGEYWIGTDGGGLNRYNPETGRFRFYKHEENNPNSLSSNRVWSILEDSADTLWVGTNSYGLNKLNTKTGEVKRYIQQEKLNKSISHNWILTLFKDSKNNLWIGTMDGLNLYDRKNDSFIRFYSKDNNPNSLSHNSILSIYEDSQNYLWIGTYGGGVNRFDPTSGNFKQFHYDKNDPFSLSNEMVTAIHEDQKGRLWFATLGGGINLLEKNGNTFTQFSEKQGLANNVVYGILESKAGNLWMSTNKGISKLDTQTYQFTNYNVQDGTQSNEFNSGAYAKTNDGKLLFGGINGFNVFAPDELATKKIDTPVTLTNMRVFNREVKNILDKEKSSNDEFKLEKAIYMLNEIELSYRENQFSFDFSSLRFVNSKQIQYAYQLENWNSTWFYTNYLSRRATFTNIPAGEYYLNIKAGRYGEWDKRSARLRIKINPPPWETWWAQIIYLFFIMITIIWFIRSQRKKVIKERIQVEKEREINNKLVKMDRLKDEFLANTSHELRTPLNGIVGLAESLVDGVKGELNADVIFDLEMMAKSGRRLAHLVNDILDFSKMKEHQVKLHLTPIDLYSLVDVVLRIANPLLFSKPIKLINLVDPNLVPVVADEDRLQQMLYNLVGNAIKFTEQGKVTISAEVQDNKKVKITVKDTGIGICESELPYIFTSFQQGDGSCEREFEGTGLGLALTQKLAELHNTTIDVVSKHGYGSEFSIRLSIADEDLLNHLGVKTKSVDLTTDSLIDKATVSSIRKKDELVNEEKILKYESIESNKGMDINEQLDETIVNVNSNNIIDSRTAAINTRILVVDDDAINRHVIRNQLTGQPFELLDADSASSALSLLDKDKNIDLVLLDVMMPKMSGYELCSRIRKKYSIHELPIIFLTAKSQIDDLVECFSSGANDYICKPIERKELVSRVLMHLELLRINRVLKQKVLQKNKNITAIADIGRLITAGFDKERTLYTVYKSIKELMPVDIFGVGLYEKSKAEIRYDFCISGETRYKPYVRYMTNKTQLPVWCVENKKVIFINDIKKEVRDYIPDFSFAEEGEFDLIDGKRAKTPHSMIYSPIIANDEILGVLSVQCFETGLFRPGHLSILQSIVSYTAIALKNASMHERFISVEKEKSKEIEKQKLLAEKATESKSQFLATMSHEIRTPMNGVIGIVELLKDSKLNKKQQYYVDVIQRSGESLIDIINDILDYSKIEAKKIELEKIEFSIQDLIEDCIQTFRASVNNKLVDLIGVISPDVPLYVKGDATRLRQILINLLGNAFKFTEQGEIYLMVSISSYTKSCEIIKFEIKDSGIGIPKSSQGKLFKLFSQAEADTNRKYGGSGLGLAISKKLVELMGGEIGVKSKLGEGSLFWFTAKLPIATNKVLNEIDKQNEKLISTLNDKKLLIVSQNEKFASLIKLHLSKWLCAIDICTGFFEGKLDWNNFEEQLKIADMIYLDSANNQFARMMIKKVRGELNYQTPIFLGQFEKKSISQSEIKTLKVNKVLIKPLIISRFVLNLAKTVSSEFVLDSNEKNTSLNQGYTFPSLKVLVAEDNKVNQIVINGLLKKLDIEATIVENGKLAVETFIDSSNHYDFVFMDCQMPEMDGYQACKEIRRYEKEKQQPNAYIVALSAHAPAEYQLKAFESGMDYYLHKPVRMTDIIKAFKSLGIISE